MNILPIKILLLDDDSFMLKLLTRMLENLGCAPVAACGSGRAALEEIDSPNGHPDLILLDINMPEMDGVEFIRHLVERHYSGGIILVSGEDQRMLQAAVKLVQAHEIPVLGYLKKPVSPTELASLLDKWPPPAQGASREVKKSYAAHEVRAAIDNGELVNYYHPKVAVATGRVVGMETLVRWHHPRDGIVLPGQFIGVAEEAHDLIDGLGRAVLTGALAQARIWREDGLVLQLAVNLSIKNLASLDFADFVAARAAAEGVPPQMVVLEVTERCLAQDMRASLETLARLRLKRFRLSIDDFSTGYSSLTQLRDIPFDELKIDQCVVHGAWASKTDQVKYDACLGTAKQLGMEVVAEGVEDRDDWDFLRRTGCDLAQGYFIARPMPAADLPGWMESWRVRVQQYPAAGR